LNLIKEQQSSLLEGTLNALTFDIETYLDDLERMTITPYLNEDIMKALKSKSSPEWNLLAPYKQYEASELLTKTLPKYFTNMREDILGTILLPMDGSVYITSPNNASDRLVKDYPFSEQDWYNKAIKADGRVAFISVHVQNYLEATGATVFSVARLLKDFDSQRPLGVIMADADTAALEQMMTSIRLSKESIAVILDDNKQVIYANHPISVNMRQQLATDALTINEVHEQYSVVSVTVKRSNWRIVILSPESFIKSHLQRVYWIGFGFASSGLLIALILYLTVSYWMVNPFKQMTQVMKRVQRGDMNSFYPIRGKDEISQLGQNLNTMIITLGELIDREYKAALGQRNAEYKALQSQIHPHFLYNILNGFIALNRTGQSMLLEKAILSLSGILRYTLEHNDWAQLQEEMDFITKYCELQQIRFAEKIKFQMICDPRVRTTLIPKLLLQPFIENAIIHGIEPSDKACELSMSISLQTASEDAGDQLLIINICDNGVGFDSNQVHEGVGVINVRERLAIAYEGAILNIESNIGLGTFVRIQIPLKGVKPQ
jgi:two-component system sensor histidine kinase YesM